MVNFSSLSIESWLQFERISIDFNSRLTVLTGANGSGKTTLLRLLALHRGWPATHVATPAKNRITGAIEFLTRWFKGEDKSDDTQVGTLSYTDGTVANLVIPGRGNVSYQVAMQGQASVNCIFMPSHRQVFRYEPLQHIPITKKTEQTAFDEVLGVAISRHHGNSGQSTSFFMKNTLIGWAIHGHGVQAGNKTVMPADNAQRSSYDGFQKVLRQLLPTTLGFEEFEIRNMEIVFICNGGQDEFLLETASGGISTLIDLAWQLFMFSRANPGEFVAIIDEAENHLHPSLQRALLPNLLATFPTAKFVVSTHSPLIVGSVRDANVYVLRYTDGKKVVSEKLDLENKTRNAMEILDEVLGVSTTLPIWVEEELDRIIREASSGGINSDTIPKLREQLKKVGMEHLLPEAISRSF